MKKIYLLLLGVFTLLVFSPNVSAANASVNVKANNKTLVVGSSTKVTVTVSSSDLGAWEYCISYDSSVLKLTSSTADANTCVKAGYVEKKGQTSSTETFTFKAIKSGSSKVTVKSYAIYSYSTESVMNTSASSVTIKTMTQAELEDTYSTNANLKSLAVDGYVLTPVFNKNTLEYKVEVPNEVASANISATREDSTAQISGDGVKELTEGDNKFEIIVTAQKGNTKTYVVNVYRKELDPISVKVDNHEYFIVRKSDALPQYPTFNLTNIQYQGEEIPALHSEITGYTIVGLKNDDSKIDMFIYENEEFRRYEEVKSNALTIFPQELPNDEDFQDYEKVEIDFRGMKISGYSLNKNSNFVIIYGQNIETGDIQYYSYNKKNNTIQEYSTELGEYFNEKIKIYKYIILGFIGLTIILLLIIIFRKKTKIVKVSTNSQAALDEEKRNIEAEIEREIQENKNKKKNKGYDQEDLIKGIPEIESFKEETRNEIRLSRDDKTIELKGFSNEISNKNLSKKELKKQAKKMRKEEKSRLKEF